MTMVERPTSRMHIPWPPVVVGVIVVLVAVWVWMNFYQTYHFVTVEEKVLYRDGMRSVREFNTACQSARPKVIVSLLDGHEQHQPPFDEEMEYCRKSKLKLARIPIRLG